VTAAIGEAFVRIRPDTAGFAGETQRAVSGAIGAIGSGLKGAGRDLVGLGALGAAALGGIGIAAVKASSEFNAAVSAVGAVSNASAADLDRLREAALQAGADTSFSASQAAEAQGELARAGVSVTDILGGGLSGALSLAAAGQLDLGEAATTAAQAMNIFGLGGSDVTTIADTLAAGANKSAADVSSLGQALRQGGLAAAQSGLSLQETVGTLSLFADNALVGSDAGTSFKTMLQRFVPQSEEARRTMEQLGLSFFDAQGNFVGIENAAEQLQNKLGGLSEEQRATALNTLFGADAFRAASILAEAGAEGVQEYTAAVSDTGAAARVAAQNLDNLKGDVEALRGSFETALIRSGDLFDPLLRAGTQTATDLVNVFNDFATGPAFERIGFRLDLLAAQFRTAFGGVTTTLTDALGKISAADVDEVFDRIETALAGAREAVEGAGIALGVFGTSLATTFLRGVPLIGGFVPAFNPVLGALAGLVLQSDEGRDAVARLGERAVEVGGRLGGEFLSTLASVADTLGASLGTALEVVGTAALEVADVLGPVLATGIEQLGPPIGDLIENLGQLVGEVLPPLGSLLADVLGPAFAILAPVVQLVADAVGVLAANGDVLIPVLGAIAGYKLAGIVGDWITPLRNLGEAFAAVGDIAKTRGVSGFEAFRGVVGTSATGAVSSLKGALLTSLNPAVLGVTAAVSAGIGIYEAWSSAKRRAESVTKSLADALLTEESAYSATLDALRQNVGDLGVTEAAEAAGLSLKEVSEEIRAFPGSFDEFRKVFQGNAFTDEFRESFSIGWDAIEQRAAEAGVRIPESVRQIKEAVDAGLISEDQGRELINAFTDVDQSSALASDNIVLRFRDLESAAKDAGINISDFATRFNAATTFEERKAILDELIAKYPELGEAIGEVGTSSEEAAEQVRGLVDALAELAGGQLEVDQAQRSFLDGQQRLLESLQQNGLTLDQNTEAGRRNRDALDGAVEAAFALAEAQLATDASGQASTATLIGMAGTLASLQNQGVITEGQYQQLLATYGLTPELITSRIEADTAQAKAEAEDIRQRILNLPGASQQEKLDIIALVDKGDIATAQAKLNALERTYTASVSVSVGDLATRVSSQIASGIARAAGSARGVREAKGGILEFYAAGGLAESHLAQIAPAGAWRVWAEPETGGEAYIPLSAEPWRRKRSEAILREVARRFGMSVYASGGVTDGVAITTPTVSTGVTFAGPVTFGSDARSAIDELDWWARYRLRAR
jgi:TP901 family phage tail tape measure protein